MSDIWTVLSMVKGQLTRARVMTEGGSFMLTNRGFDGAHWIVDVFDLETHVNVEITLIGDEDVMERALDMARKAKAFGLFTPPLPAPNSIGPILPIDVGDDWLDI